jgi:hypothetical protein
MTKALLIPATGDSRIITLPSENAHTVIHDFIGGYFDCASLADGAIAMYVHDEGLLIGLEPNVTASILYGSPIAGDVVIVGTLNAKGERDGYDYDLPDFMYDPVFIARATIANNTEYARQHLASLIETMDFSPRIVPMTDEMMDEWLGVK